MSRVLRRLAGLIVAGLLTGCSSTMPQSASIQPDALPTITPGQAPSGDGTGSAAVPQRSTPAPAITPTPGDGPVTASMEKLKISGERYATLGDPSAPVTLVEFSDYG